jgi:hypothetical protein
MQWIDGDYSAVDFYLSLPSSSLSLDHLPHCPQRTEGDYSEEPKPLVPLLLFIRVSWW